MKSKVIWALVMLNVALAVALLWRSSSGNAALAQMGGAHAPSDVIMLPGTLPSGSNSILYLIDVGGSPHQLSAMAYTGQSVEFLTPPIDLDRLFERAAAAAGGGGNKTGTNTGTGVGPGAAGPGVPRVR
jgi:hypothetical protein